MNDSTLLKKILALEEKSEKISEDIFATSISYFTENELIVLRDLAKTQYPKKINKRQTGFLEPVETNFNAVSLNYGKLIWHKDILIQLIEKT